MAEYSSGTASGSGVVPIDNFVLAIRDIITRNGWTLIDTLNNTLGSRDLIFKSEPIDAIADNRCYMRVHQLSSTTMNFFIYTDWDTVTHAGANATNGVTCTLLSSAFPYFIRANEWSLAVSVNTSPFVRTAYSGFVRRPMRSVKSGCTKTTSGYAIGTSTMNVASSMVGKLKVGQKVLIYNNSHSSVSPNFGNAEVLTIQSIASGSLTFTSTSTKAYDTGAVIGQLAFPGVSSPIVSGTSDFEAATAYMPFDLNGTRVGSTSHTAAFSSFLMPNDFSALDASSSTYRTHATGFYSAYATGASVTGQLGYLYHLVPSSHNSQNHNDVMDDGDSLYTTLALGGSTRWTTMGPQ